MKKYALTSALTHVPAPHADTIVLGLKLELSGVQSCFIHCGYCTSQPTCSLLCDIMLPLILLHYQLFSSAKIIIYIFMCRQSHVRKLAQTGATTRGSLGSRARSDLSYLLAIKHDETHRLLFIELIFHKC